MPDTQLLPPHPDEIEISVFGPGYGEAILVHLGSGKWVIVDSCMDPVSGFPAPSKYLHDLKVDLSDAVKLIVATHWHDDHVKGLGDVFNECESAQLVISSALTTEEFIELAMVHTRRPYSHTTGVDEFGQLFRQLQTRKGGGVRFAYPNTASANKTLYTDKLVIGEHMVDVKVCSLSPSDGAVLKANAAFAQMKAKAGASRQWIGSPTENHTSVVVWIEIGQHKILLGADLENTTDDQRGWLAILNNCLVMSGKAHAFKVPHHGSENAHEDRVWSEILEANPLVFLTPYRRGKKLLPSSNDIRRLRDFSTNAYLTAPTTSKKPKWSDRVVRESMEEVARNFGNIHAGWGHIRLRQKINDPASSWAVELFGDAYHLSRSQRT